MEDIERILLAVGAETNVDYRILVGSASVYLAFQDKPGIAYSVDPEGSLLVVPYAETPELVK